VHSLTQENLTEKRNSLLLIWRILLLLLLQSLIISHNIFKHNQWWSKSTKSIIIQGGLNLRPPCETNCFYKKISKTRIDNESTRQWSTMEGRLIYYLKCICHAIKKFTECYTGCREEQNNNGVKFNYISWRTTFSKSLVGPNCLLQRGHQLISPAQNSSRLAADNAKFCFNRSMDYSQN
jgi:hypothetical protein